MILVTITGHLGKDAVVRESNGRKFISFTMCSTVKRGNTERSTWVSVFYRYSENLVAHLTRGKHVLVAGECEVSVYNGQGGAQVDMTVNASTLQFIGSQNAPQAAAADNKPYVAKNDTLFPPQTDDNDAPF